MSNDILVVNKTQNIQDNSLKAAYNSHEQYFFACNNITSLVVKDIRFIKTDFSQFYQHNKQELNELNERFRQFLSSVQSLELENSQFALEIDAFQKKYFDFIQIDEQWNENYKNSQSKLKSIANEKFANESDFELSQLQIQFYQQLYNFQQRSNEERRSKLERELKQSLETLGNLKNSYQTLEQEMKGLYISHDDAVKQYLSSTREWCSLKKQQKQVNFDVQTLKSQLVCYKSLHAHAYQATQAFITPSIDASQFWSLEFDKCVEKIRHDFEILYATIYRNIVAYYEEKQTEMQTEVEQSFEYRKHESEAYSYHLQALQEEYDEVQVNLAYEKERQAKYEAEYVKLEAAYKALQIQNDEKFQEQEQLLVNGQQEIVTIACDIGDIRRSTVALESEIIVYRHLLDSIELRQAAPTGSEIAEKVVVINESKRKGPIGIKECAASGKYIVLVNHSSTQDVDISKWVLKRRLDSVSTVLYTIPSGTELKHGNELTIYSKLGADVVDSALDSRTISTFNQEIISDDVVSWGMGTAVETFLIDRNGEEKASHIQSLGFGGNTVYDE